MFEAWADRVSSVTEEGSRRALLAEIAVSRARHLSDVPATRQATWALSKLHKLLGEPAKAVSEAQQLLSLCQTPPVASRDEAAAAAALLVSLGEKVPVFPSARNERPRRERAPRSERPPRGDRPARSERGAKRADDPVAEARTAAGEGKTRNVRRIAADRRGPTWSGFRAWSLLADASTGDDAALRKAVEQAMGELAHGLGVRIVIEDELSKLMGAPLPTKRRAAITALEQFAEAHPDRLDELVATALTHHVNHSVGSSASWLSGLVGRALATGGAAVKSTLAELAQAPAMALYDSWAFHRAVRLAQKAVAAGWAYEGLREGVMHRGEPDDRRVWTLRLSREGGRRLLAIAPHATARWPEGVAAQLGDRLAKLSSAAVLVASGAGNQQLREAASALGVVTLDEDADDATLLAALEAREPDTRERPTAPAEASADKAPRGPSPPELLTAMLTADTPPTEEALTEIVATFRRPSSALRVAERAEASLTLAPALLRAVHAVEEAGRTLAEGTTLAVRAAAAGVTEARDALTSDDLGARYGGPGIGTLADLGQVLVSDGWELFRVLRGATRREREKFPVLDTLAPGLDGLWRLLVRKGEIKGEVWYIAELSVEGRAGVPQLLLSEHQRAIVLPIDPDLLTWYGSLSGPEAIGWAGNDEAEALRAAVGAWV